MSNFRCNTCQFFACEQSRWRVKSCGHCDQRIERRVIKNLYRLRHTFFQDFFSRTPIRGMGLDTNDTHVHVLACNNASNSCIWLPRSLSHRDVLVFLGCFIAMTSSWSPWLYFQFSMTETILELVAMIFFIQLKEHQSKDHPFFMFCYLCCHLRYSDLEFAAPPIWLRCSFFIYPAFLKTPPSEKKEWEP